jgi:DNA-binding transcriptional regulator YiaG
MTPAEQIRSIRAQTGLSQQAFAAAYEIPKRTIENWESGSRTPPPYVIRLLELAVKALPPDKLEDPD